MALWGKGDQRWIVSERDDGTNVNQWHWNEKNINDSFKKHLELEFKKHITLNETNQLVIDQLNNFHGSISIVNRKNKKKLNYNFGFHLNAKLVNQHETKDLTIKIPEIFDYEPDITIQPYTIINDTIETSISSIIGSVLKNYDIDKSIVLDETNNVNKSISQYTNLIIKFQFNIPFMSLFDTFSNIEHINKFTHSDNIFNLTKDTDFSFYHNTINGILVDFVINKYLKMKWKLSKWKQFSYLHLDFQPETSNTILTIKYNDIPIEDKQYIKELFIDKWCIPICIYLNANFQEILK